MALELVHIQSRADFFRVLGEVIQETEQKHLAEPSWRFLESVLSQLYHIRNTTAHGRKPTFEERRSINIGLLAEREMEGVSDLKWDDYKDKLTDIAFYYQFWRTDAGLATLDDDDWRTDFPQDYDLSDEPDAP